MQRARVFSGTNCGKGDGGNWRKGGRGAESSTKSGVFSAEGGVFSTESSILDLELIGMDATMFPAAICLVCRGERGVEELGARLESLDVSVNA